MRSAWLSASTMYNFRALSLFRIGLSLYLIGDFIVNDHHYFYDIYGPNGILPLSTLADFSRWPGYAVFFPVLSLLQNLGVLIIFRPLYYFLLILLLIGFRTRRVTHLVFLMHAFLYWRNPAVRSGAEMLAHLLLLWSSFLPLNRYWSIDIALAPSERDKPWPIIPIVAFNLQIFSLYFFAVLFKLRGGMWRDGTALFGVLSDNILSATPAAQYLVAHHRDLLTVGTYAVIVFQLALPLIMYSPWRPVMARSSAVGALFCLHLSFIILLNIGGFPYLCFAVLFALLPDEFFRWLTQSNEEKFGSVEIYYDPDCEFCRKISLIIREFCLPARAAVLPASTDAEMMHMLRQHNSWVVRGADGRVYLKWQAMSYVLRCSRVFYPLGWITDISLLRSSMTMLYDAIGRNRGRLGQVTACLKQKHAHVPPGQFGVAVCFGLAVLGLMSNISSVVTYGISEDRQGTSSSALDEITSIAQVHQRWPLFAPTPTHDFREIRLAQFLADGTVMDSEAGLRDLPWYWRHDGKALRFVNHRWQKYMTRFIDLPPRSQAALGHYLCRKLLQNGHTASRVVSDIEIVVTSRPAAGLPWDGISVNEARRKVSCASNGAV